MDVLSQPGDWFVTRGLVDLGMHELALHDERPAWSNDARTLLAYTMQYVESSGNRIVPGQTMSYGFWLVKFVLNDSSVLEVHEYDEDGELFVKGARLSMEFWREQHRICQIVGAAFHPPRPDKLVAVSSDLPHAAVVEGVRYNLEDPMSGWIITSQGYDGPVQTLRGEHAWHLVRLRRDLIRFLALPVGYRFTSDREDAVRFDPGVATAK